MAVLAHICDHVGHAHDAALERGGAQRGDDLLVGCALLDKRVERLERSHIPALELLLGELAVVAEHTVERLQAHVAAIELVEHAHGMDVVVEIAIGALVVAAGQEPLARMPERRVPQIVPERDGLDEVAVQPE